MFPMLTANSFSTSDGAGARTYLDDTGIAKPARDEKLHARRQKPAVAAEGSGQAEMATLDHQDGRSRPTASAKTARSSSSWQAVS